MKCRITFCAIIFMLIIVIMIMMRMEIAVAMLMVMIMKVFSIHGNSVDDVN